MKRTSVETCFQITTTKHCSNVCADSAIAARMLQATAAAAAAACTCKRERDMQHARGTRGHFFLEHPVDQNALKFLN